MNRVLLFLVGFIVPLLIPLGSVEHTWKRRAGSLTYFFTNLSVQRSVLPVTVLRPTS